MSKISDFISLIMQAARGCAIGVGVEQYRQGSGVLITSVGLTNPNVDIDRFLIEITALADEDQMGMQLSLPRNNTHIKNEFQKHGFTVIHDEQSLQMERNPQGISYEELEFMESAPSGDKAKRFIKHQKADFKKRYGKHWKQVLYATAWKQFGETRTFSDYLALVECVNEK